MACCLTDGAALARACLACSMRSLVEVGVRSGTYERSYLDARLTNSKPSSGGRSTTMKPATPLALHSDMSRSSPKAKKGL
eukprot:724698-Pleurochrysis_carterae.AAC.1